MIDFATVISKLGVPFKWLKSKYDKSVTAKVELREKRLPIYQEAFKLVQGMFSFANKIEGKSDYVKKCWEWYDNNCLYLDPIVRTALHRAINACSIHSDIPHEHIRANWKYIEDARDAIQKAIDG